MFMIEDKIIPEVASTPLPDLPPVGQVLAKQAVGHLDPLTGVVLINRLAERSAYGAKKFGDAWADRNNCVELCEETTDALVYGAQEATRVETGLTPLAVGGDDAIRAREFLAASARYAALADHNAQMAAAVIYGNPIDGR